MATFNVSDLSQVLRGGCHGRRRRAEEAAGLLKGKFDIVKILGDGEIDKALDREGSRFSKSAKEKIEKAGGTAEVLS